MHENKQKISQYKYVQSSIEQLWSTNASTHYSKITVHSASFQVLCLGKPEFEDPVGVVAPAYENHSVPDAKMVNAWDDEHSPRSILLQVLILDCKTVIFTIAVASAYKKRREMRLICTKYERKRQYVDYSSVPTQPKLTFYKSVAKTADPTITNNFGEG